jgi:hypothetical protein
MASRAHWRLGRVVHCFDERRAGRTSALVLGGLGQVEEMGPLRLVELERAANRIEDTGRCPGEGTTLELGVVLDAQSGERRDLASAQTGDAAVRSRR